jgi:hypothetical protein
MLQTMYYEDYMGANTCFSMVRTSCLCAVLKPVAVLAAAVRPTYLLESAEVTKGTTYRNARGVLRSWSTRPMVARRRGSE